MNTRDTIIELIDNTCNDRSVLSLGAFFRINEEGLLEEEVRDITEAIREGRSYFARFQMGGDYEIKRAA